MDEYQNTTASGIYALGDVAGKALLTPGQLSLPVYTCVLTNYSGSE